MNILTNIQGSIPPSGAFFGSILAAPLLHYIGRKRTIVTASPIGMIGWLLIATATRYETIIFGRFLNGFCVGLCLPSAQVYVSFFVFDFVLVLILFPLCVYWLID